MLENDEPQQSSILARGSKILNVLLHTRPSDQAINQDANDQRAYDVSDDLKDIRSESSGHGERGEAVLKRVLMPVATRSHNVRALVAHSYERTHTIDLSEAEDAVTLMEGSLHAGYGLGCLGRSPFSMTFNLHRKTRNWCPFNKRTLCR